MSKEEGNFYSRMNEFGEYKYNSRLDTLFVLQLSFIIILIFIALYYLSLYGFFSKASMYIVTMLLTIVLTLIILNRAYVLPKMRSKFIWDKYNFGNNTETPTKTQYLQSGVDGGQSGTSPSQTCETQTVCTQGLQI